jgi:hypothetical protein
LLFWYNSRYFSKVGALGLLVTLLLFVAIHTNKKIMDMITLHKNMEINHTIIFYASLRDRRFENH